MEPLAIVVQDPSCPNDFEPTTNCLLDAGLYMTEDLDVVRKSDVTTYTSESYYSLLVTLLKIAEWISLYPTSDPFSFRIASEVKCQVNAMATSLAKRIIEVNALDITYLTRFYQLTCFPVLRVVSCD